MSALPESTRFVNRLCHASRNHTALKLPNDSLSFEGLVTSKSDPAICVFRLNSCQLHSGAK